MTASFHAIKGACYPEASPGTEELQLLMPKKSGTMLVNVHAARALASLMVLYLHLEGVLSRLGIEPFGGFGVDLFFVISGFIMVYTTEGRSVRPLAFFFNRITRIVPAYWLLTFLVFALVALVPSLFRLTTADPFSLVKSLFFVPFAKPGADIPQPVLFVGWTLNYEMFFYLVFAVSLALRQRLEQLLFTTVLLGGCGLYGLFGAPQNFYVTFYTQPIGLEFIFGMWGGYLYSLMSEKRRPAVALSVLVAIVAAVLLITVLEGVFGRNRALVAGIPSFVIVLGAAYLEKTGYGLRSRAVVALGDASYVIYLGHVFVTRAAEWAAARFELDGLAASGLLLVTAGLVVGFGLLFHLWVEKPMTKVLRSVLTPVFSGDRRLVKAPS